MTKKHTPVLTIITLFIVVAFATMIYGFTHADPFFVEKSQGKETTHVSYSLPNLIPSVWLSNN